MMKYSIVDAREIYPYGCKPMALRGEVISIPEGDTRLILFHNLSKMDLWITPVTQHQTRPMSTRIKSGLWSALVTEKESLILNCIESRPGHEQHIACFEGVAACEWLLDGHPDKPTGLFWGAENRALGSLTAYLGRQGFVVPSPVQ